jgi:hypothetical protein
MRFHWVLLGVGLVSLAACREKKPAPPVNEFFPGHKHVGGGDDGGDDAPDWVPAEFKNGRARWKDTGVYLDGKPIAMLSFGELPVTLEPIWVEQHISANKRYGTDDPGWTTIKQRRYRFSDYFKALGVDLNHITEVHVYGPRVSSTIVVSGKEILERPDFGFRFAGDIEGKALPVIPPNLGNRMRMDKISAVMVYAEKKPPILVRSEGMMLDGDYVEGVPYRGEPLRGGIRLYFDDHLVGLIKRNTLDGTLTGREEGPNGIRWKLFPFLEGQGIDTKRIAEAIVIRDDRKREVLSRADLENATFEAAPQKRGEIWLGEKKLRVHHLAFFSQHATLHDDIQDYEISFFQ